MFKKILLLSFLFVFMYSEDTTTSLTRQKIEVLELKKELNTFYNEKEQEYKNKKKELENILAKIEKEKSDIKKIHDDNEEILKDIKMEIESKTIKIYNSMKPKDAAEIFNQMIIDEKIDDVFDIIVKLKENNVTQIMKFLSVPNAAMLTNKLKNYKVNGKD